MNLQYQLLHTSVDAGLEGILAEHLVAQTSKLGTRKVVCLTLQSSYVTPSYQSYSSVTPCHLCYHQGRWEGTSFFHMETQTTELPHMLTMDNFDSAKNQGLE